MNIKVRLFFLVMSMAIIVIGTVIALAEEKQIQASVESGSMVPFKPHTLDVRGASKMNFGPFGDFVLYRPEGQPIGLVLFYSGDGGWNKRVADMALVLVEQNVIIAGIDIRQYYNSMIVQKEPNVDLGNDAVELKNFLFIKEKIDRTIPTILIGYSSGATMIYAIMATVPAKLFKGGLSLGFCPDMLLPKPLNADSGLESVPSKEPHTVIFKPVSSLSNPWVLFQGDLDQVCDPSVTKEFVAKIPSARIVEFAEVGHGFKATDQWVNQFRDEFKKMLTGKNGSGPETP